MARNEEKALTLFNKWQTFKKDFHSVSSNKRPLHASECESIQDAEKWRRELVRDLTKKIAAIRNGSLGEHRIRELNDEINKMMRQKHYWEIRVRELGGTIAQGKQLHDVEGKELPGAPGYRYYGAAKDLPGVRELFAEQDEESALRKQKKRSRAELYKFVTPDYYGYRDDDDGVLLPLEQEREEQMQHELGVAGSESSDEEGRQLRALRDISASIMSSVGEEPSSVSKAESGSASASRQAGEEEQRRMEEALFEKKKQALLNQFK